MSNALGLGLYINMKSCSSVQYNSIICLILNIKSNDYIINKEVLRHANIEDMEVMLVRTRLCWLGHEQ